MLYNIKCNNMKCNQEIKKITMVTTCGHIFCYQCTNKVKNVMRCIACSTFLQPNDAKIKELGRKVDLFGYSPEKILEACRSGINFWFYQMNEEMQVMKLTLEKENKFLHEKVATMENEMIKMKTEMAFLEQKLCKSESALERERQNVFELHGIIEDKNREVQKLNTKNEKLKFNVRKYEDLEFSDSENVIRSVIDVSKSQKYIKK
ncbi:hypothetical protein EDEG_02747 [Edhazardia aedis USNM 41457]|uniref:RING-type domain-containing protein n=1 Tax=Edhazardia aedis (strain USNM 41457) TaxID=1003232 RepID=J9DNA7_EDHAE|nr:hypothetical protein EDEG_02747 [Edhazardia aedis USNM 41457]|eukprot:EJW02867.1 hypothetical protein EDEG_02747 [Edhazardia aedis USNM 41457]